MADEMYVEPTGPLSHAVLSRTTSWFAPLMRLQQTNASADMRDQDLYALVDGFVDDIECGIVYSAAEHLATQMSFITSGYSERAVIDFQLKLTNISSDLDRLRAKIDYPFQGNQSRWKCPLGRENDAAAKAKLVVSKDDYLYTFAKHPELVQRLCTVYIQDYLCLGFQLPLECEGGRELAWSYSRGTGRELAKTAKTHSRGTYGSVRHAVGRHADRAEAHS